MDTLEFLQRVLPGQGFYVIAVKSNGRMRQRFFGTVDHLAAACSAVSTSGHNTYYAISAYAQSGSRKKENVRATKVVAMDVDCGGGKPYATQRDGLKAFLAFMQATGLPRPMVVNSGRGLHVYWVLDRDLSPVEWQPLADGMKVLANQHGFHVDPAVTADSARILRPTQTINYKNGATVDVLIDARPVSPQTLLNIIPTAPPLSPSRGFRASQMIGSLETQDEFPPRDPMVVIDKCKQIKWGVENQDKVSEPFWYAMMGVAAYCADPEGTAKAWSDQYPGYSEAETIKKVTQWKTATTGPATCKRFQDERQKGCAACPLAGKIKTPAAIGTRYEDAVAATPAAGVVDIIPVPWPFKRAKNPKTGCTMFIQTVDGTDIEIAPFDIHPVGYGRDHGLGYETVRYRWDRPHVGWQDLSFRQAYLNEENREFATALADQGIVLSGRKQLEAFRYMLRSYMDNLRSLKTMTNLHGSMGWKDDHTQFVIGNRLYRRNADATVTREDISVAAGTQRQAAELFRTAGSAETWSQSTALFAGLLEYGFALGVSLAAPLVEFTGLKGVVLSLVGETGAGKTLCQLVQQSVWGVPNELHFNSEYTQNALFSRVGFYSNLPMTVDETTLMKNEDVGKFVYWVTQGRDKARLDRNATEREARTWATTVTVSTNKSMVAKLTASGTETSAQMARMVELTMPHRKGFLKGTDFGHRIHDLFCENYGHAGDAIIMEYMKLGADGLKQRIKEHTAAFEKKYGVHFAGAERYWKMLFVLADLALVIAAEAGIIRFAPHPVVVRALQDVPSMRRSIEDTEFDAFDLVTEYLRKFADQIVTVMHSDGQKGTLDLSRVPRGEVRARLDLYRKSAVEDFETGTVMLISRQFKEWLAMEGHDIRAVRNEIVSQGGDATPADKRFWFGRDTSLKYGQFHCMGVRLNHPRMAGFLKDQQQTASELTFGRMAIVEDTANG